VDGSGVPATIDEAVEAALRDPEKWPEIVAAVRSKPFVAREFINRSLPVHAAVFREPDSPQERDAWFVEGAVLFEALLAFEAFSSSQAGLQELVLLGRPKGADSIQTAGLPPGNALRIAAKLIDEAPPGPPYTPIALEFAASVLGACDRELERQKREAGRGRVTRWLLAKVAPPGPFEPHRLLWRHEEVLQLRIGALTWRAGLRSASGQDEAGARADYDQAEAGIVDLDRAAAWRAKGIVLGERGRVEFNQGRYDRAIAALNEAITAWEQNMGAAPSQTDTGMLGELLAIRARAENKTGDPRQALQDFDRGIELLRMAGWQDTNTIGSALLSRGSMHADMNQFNAADADLTEALRIFESLPANAETTESVMRVLSNRGFARVRLRQLDDAIADLTRALDIAETTPVKDAQDVQATARHNRGNAFYEQGRVPAAIEDLSEVFRIRGLLAQDESTEHLDSYAAAGRDLGRVVLETRSAAEALPLLQQVVVLRTHRIEQKRNADTIHAWAMAMIPLTAAQLEAGQLENALANAKSVVDAYRELVNIYGLSARRLDLAAALHTRAHVLFRLKRFAEARQDQDRALAMFRELAASETGETYSTEIGRALAAAGEMEEKAGNLRAAAALLEESANELEHVVPAAETEQERQFRRASYSTNVRRLIHLACQLDRAGEAVPDPADGGGATWAERAVCWSERNRARNLSDLMAAAHQRPFGVLEEDCGW
jgi:tetratricopeptide (TPR) repeat protein